MESVSSFSLAVEWQDRTYSSSDSENINNDDDDISDDQSDESSIASTVASSAVVHFEPGLSSSLTEMDLNDPRVASDDTAQSKSGVHNLSVASTEQSYTSAPPESSALPFTPRGYQLELFRRATKENIIICVETGAGKTLISSMLIKHVLENASPKPSPLPTELSTDTHSRSMPDITSRAVVDANNNTLNDPVLLDSSSLSLDLSTSHSISNEQQSSATVVFLAHRVPLALQQADVLQRFLPSRFRVGCYRGDQGVDYWSPERWAANIASHSVLVMTAQIFLNLLRHGLISMECLSLLIVDEAHHATKNHPYRRLFVEFYHSLPPHAHRPRIFGMTATPVKKKSASSRHATCLAALTSLEATMDATVVTVSADSQRELETLVPKPDEFIVTYKSTTNEDDDLCSYSAIEETIDSDVLTNILTNTVAPDALTNCEPLTLAEMKVLGKINNRLGFIAAKDIAERFCTQHNICPDITVQSLLEQCAHLDARTAGVRDKVVKLFGVLYREFRRCIDEAHTENLSPERREKFRAIVFTHERISTVALETLINSAFAQCQCEGLTARAVVGATPSNNILVHMSQSKMQGTVDAFRRGEFGILVATNVVEEGIDVAACRLVVAFDMPTTPTAYVQSRGRARKRGARYVLFADSGVDIEQSSLWQVRESARIMVDVSRGAHITEKQRQAVRASFLREDDLNKEKKLFSRTTTARVGANDAISLLDRYCKVKSKVLCVDDLMDMRFEDCNEGKMFTTSVYLDERIPIDGGHCTDPQLTITLARRLAALDAYSKLYDIGEVDEYLLPKKGPRSRRILEVSSGCDPSGQKKNSKKKNRLPVESRSAKKHKRMRKCDIAHPLEIQAPKPIIKITNHSANSNAPDSSMKITDRINPEDNDIIIIDVLDVTDEKVYLYEIEMEEELDVFGSDKNAKKVYGIVSKTRIRTEDLKAVKCPTGEPFLSLKPCGELDWGQNDEQRAYDFVRAIQICLKGKSPGSVAAMEMEEGYSQENFTKPTFFLLPLEVSETAGYGIDWLSIENLLSFGWRFGPNEQRDMLSPAEMGGFIVCSTHENMERIYFTGELSHSLTTNSSPRGYVSDKYATFRDYYETKHDMRLKEDDVPLLPGYSLRETLSKNSTSAFMLIPDFIRVVPLDPLACFIASALPLWQKFIALRECWHRNAIHPIDFLEFSRALQPNVNNVSRWNADLCYERYEFLGDSVLKVINSVVKFVHNPDGDEGDLSDARDIEVSNSFLADIALRMKLHDCIAYSGVSHKAKSWPWFWGSYEKKPVNVSEKVLADCVEALIGCHFQNGGFVSACIFLEKYGLLRDVCQTLCISASHDTVQNRDGVAINIPALAPDDNRYNSSFITEVEKKIGYEFREKRHLVVALTHGSHQNGHCVSYQKYEYLGDAIVGFLLLSHFYNIYPHLGPDDLTKLRGPALSNDLFARVIVTNGIHELFWYKSDGMKQDIAAAATAILNEEDDENDVCKTILVPKVLGDLLEAILGAIVVDQGMRLDKVKDVALRLLRTELDRFANPDRFKLNVVSLLLTVVQKSFQESPKYLFLDEPDDVEKRCEVSVKGTVLGRGTGTSRRLARIAATNQALKTLNAPTGKTVLGQEDPTALLVNEDLITTAMEDIETETPPSISAAAPIEIIDLAEDTCELINLVDSE